MNAPNVPEITALELKERLDAGDDVLLVDVREPFEIAIADLPDHGQIRISSREFVSRYSEIDRDSEVVIYCRSGARSAQATQFLLANGFERVFNLEGGVLAWRLHVDPSLTAY